MDFSFSMCRLWQFILALFFSLLFCRLDVSAQEVGHNYLVGPQNTNCDSLQLSGLSIDEKISSIEKTSFRFDQGFKISRISGIRSGHFYSCDGISGFLILTIGKEKKIFSGIPKTTWDEFIKSADLDGFFEAKISNKYPELNEN